LERSWGTSNPVALSRRGRTWGVLSPPVVACHVLSRIVGKKMVPEEGVEPSRGVSPTGF